MKRIYRIISLTYCLVSLVRGIAQCPTLSPIKVTDKYSIEAVLNNDHKSVTCKQTITWANPSPNPITELRFYMYLNAFKDLNSTFLRGTDGKIFGNDIGNRSAMEWGFITIDSIYYANGNIAIQYIQPDDDNELDQTVLSATLPTACLPGESIILHLSFTAKLPKTIVRAGYGRDDYYLFVHWFPQLGVLEPDRAGNWDWNCHQFFRQTEFFADFANYEVVLDVPSHLVVGATGCMQSEEQLDGRQRLIFTAEQVIDFAWAAYPYFHKVEDQYQGIDIELLIPPEHLQLSQRYIQAIKNAMSYLEEHVGPYPYPKITIVDPPLHTLNSGFMEYPMLITCASFAYVPEGVRTIESLAIHEFTHQYFMAVIATNEKEEAWMDEGFVTFYEDQIIDHFYGDNVNNSLFDFLGFKSGNASQSRLEYITMPEHDDAIIARPGWEFEGYYKELIYAKTATALHTLKAWLGAALFDRCVKHYFDKWQFKHPKKQDLITSFKEVTFNASLPINIDSFFYNVLHTDQYCDYEVKIEKGNIYVVNNGSLSLPIQIFTEDHEGKSEIKSWPPLTNNQRPIHLGTIEQLTKVTIDPNMHNHLDLITINNSWTRSTSYKGPAKYGLKSTAIVQWVTQSLFGWI